MRLFINKSISNIQFLYITTCFLLILLLLKSIPFVIEPRIWAEEGNVYLQDSLLYGFKSVFHSHQGYYSIIPNVTLYVASLFDLKFVPYFTLCVSLFFLILLFSLIFYINNDFYNRRFKLVTSIGLFFILNSIQEIFLNVITLQFITPLILLILSFYDFKKFGFRKYVLTLLLIFICILNGPTNIFLIPIIIWKLVKINKNMGAFLVFLCFVILMTGIAHSASSGDQLSVLNRVKLNFLDILNKLLNKRFFQVLIDNVYVLVVPLYFFWKKSIDKENLTVGVLTLAYGVFFQLTQLVGGGDRYDAVVFSFMFLSVILLLFSHKKLINYVLLFVIIYFGRDFFKTNYSYSKNIKPWSTEYLNLINHKKAEIHPKGWFILIEGKER